MSEYTNKYNLPEALVSAVSADWYSQPGRIGVTTLIGSPRIRILKERHQDKLIEDASDGIWKLLGQAVHTVLERADTEGIQEQRLSMEVDGWVVTGQADLWEEPGVLSDYKITSVWAVIKGLKPEWETQLNLYAHLKRLDGKTVTKLQIVALLRDWSRGKAQQGGDYPPVAVKVIPVPLWSEEKAEKYIAERVRIHKEVDNWTDETLPVCTPEERWEKPTTWAVKKKGRKTAVRVLPTKEEANAILATKGSDHYIEERPGTSTRCENYCPVSEYCNYWQSIKGGVV